jgi:hypothetical protein
MLYFIYTIIIHNVPVKVEQTIELIIFLMA